MDLISSQIESVIVSGNSAQTSANQIVINSKADFTNNVTIELPTTEEANIELDTVKTKITNNADILCVKPAKADYITKVNIELPKVTTLDLDTFSLAKYKDNNNSTDEKTTYLIKPDETYDYISSIELTLDEPEKIESKNRSIIKDTVIKAIAEGYNKCKITAEQYSVIKDNKSSSSKYIDNEILDSNTSLILADATVELPAVHTVDFSKQTLTELIKNSSTKSFKIAGNADLVEYKNANINTIEQIQISQTDGDFIGQINLSLPDKIDNTISVQTVSSLLKQDCTKITIDSNNITYTKNDTILSQTPQNNADFSLLNSVEVHLPAVNEVTITASEVADYFNDNATSIVVASNSLFDKCTLQLPTKRTRSVSQNTIASFIKNNYRNLLVKNGITKASGSSIKPDSTSVVSTGDTILEGVEISLPTTRSISLSRYAIKNLIQNLPNLSKTIESSTTTLSVGGSNYSLGSATDFLTSLTLNFPPAYIPPTINASSVEYAFKQGYKVIKFESDRVIAHKLGDPTKYTILNSASSDHLLMEGSVEIPTVYYPLMIQINKRLPLKYGTSSDPTPYLWYGAGINLYDMRTSMSNSMDTNMNRYCNNPGIYSGRYSADPNTVFRCQLKTNSSNTAKSGTIELIDPQTGLVVYTYNFSSLDCFSIYINTGQIKLVRNNVTSYAYLSNNNANYAKCYRITIK
jgi:hypothetical protein